MVGPWGERCWVGWLVGCWLDGLRMPLDSNCRDAGPAFLFFFAEGVSLREACQPTEHWGENKWNRLGVGVGRQQASRGIYRNVARHFIFVCVYACVRDREAIHFIFPAFFRFPSIDEAVKLRCRRAFWWTFLFDQLHWLLIKQNSYQRCKFSSGRRGTFSWGLTTRRGKRRRETSEDGSLYSSAWLAKPTVDYVNVAIPLCVLISESGFWASGRLVDSVPPRAAAAQ